MTTPVRTRAAANAARGTPPRQQNGQQNGQAPPGGKKKRNAAIAGLAGNSLDTPEDLAAYLNTARKELFAAAEELDLMAAEFHSASVMLRKRLLKAAARTQNKKEKWAYRMLVRRALKPFRGAAKAAAASSDSASRSARLLRRFWRTYMDITESIVPKRRGER
jgi:hypothetical protein